MAWRSEQLLAKRQENAAALGREGGPAEAATILGEPLYVDDGYATLDPNFEGAVSALFGDGWARLHAVSSVGESDSRRKLTSLELPRCATAEWSQHPCRGNRPTRL